MTTIVLFTIYVVLLIVLCLTVFAYSLKNLFIHISAKAIAVLTSIAISYAVILFILSAVYLNTDNSVKDTNTTYSTMVKLQNKIQSLEKRLDDTIASTNELVIELQTEIEELSSTKKEDGNIYNSGDKIINNFFILIPDIPYEGESL